MMVAMTQITNELIVQILKLHRESKQVQIDALEKHALEIQAIIIRATREQQNLEAQMDALELEAQMDALE